MLKRKNTLSILLTFILILSNTLVFAQGTLAETEQGLMDLGLSIPERNASSWALDELVDSDRYGIYKSEDLYKNNLRKPLDNKFKEELLKSFKEKLEKTNLEKVEKPQFLAKVKNAKTRGGFLREIYNVLVHYEKEENLGKDPIIYLNHIGILVGNGKDLYLDRNITLEEGIIFVKRAIDYIYSENNLDSKGIMWKVENKGNTVYLLGSIHYGKPDLYPFRKEVVENFSNSDILYVEVDISNQEELMKAMMEKMAELEEEIDKSSNYKDGTTLKSVIDEEFYFKIETIMDKYGVSKEEYNNFKIKGITQKLNEIIMDEALEDFSYEDQEEFEKSMEELMDNELMKLIIEGPKLGVDFYFLDKAKTSNKKVGELESMESQLDLLFGGGLLGDSMEYMSQEDEIEILKEILEGFDNEGNILKIKEPVNEEFDEEFELEMEKSIEDQLNLIEGMFHGIKSGDGEKLAKFFIESGGSEILGGQLIGQRDKNMAKKIVELLQGEEEKTYFIVVGAAHFVVDGTILDNLRDMGYKVEKVK